MLCNTASQCGRRQKTPRLIAAFICACFIAALVLSSAFIVTHINHEHDDCGADGGCAVCAHIAAAESLLKTVSAAAALSAAALGAMSAALIISEAARCGIADKTLIGLKVRLNN
jgi:Mn2+/Fe2+ NRAMP family transporter